MRFAWVRGSEPLPGRTWPLVAAVLVLALAGGALTVAVHPIAAFAVLAAGIVGLVMVQDAFIALLVSIGVLYLLPFGVLPLGFLGGLKPTLLDASLTVLLLVWLLRRLARPEEPPVLTPVAGPLALFLGLAFVSLILGIESTSDEVLRFFIKTVNSLLFYVSVVNVMRDRPQLLTAVRALTALAIAAAAIALMLYFLSTDLANRLLSLLRPLGYPSGDVLRFIAYTDTQRAIGTAIDPNVLGGMLLIALPLLLVQLFGEVQTLPRRWLAVGLGLVVLALLLTYSRSSWIGAVAAALFVIATRYRRAVLPLAGLLAALLLLPQGELFVGRFQEGIAFQDLAAQMRLGEYKDALALIERYPWFGVGFGQSPDVSLYVAVASIYLLIAEQMGLIGLAAFLLTMATFAIWMAQQRRTATDAPLKALQLGLNAGVVGALVAGLFDHYFMNLQFPHTVALFWLFVGLAAAASRLGGLEPASAENEGAILIRPSGAAPIV